MLDLSNNITPAYGTTSHRYFNSRRGSEVQCDQLLHCDVEKRNVPNSLATTYCPSWKGNMNQLHLLLYQGRPLPISLPECQGVDTTSPEGTKRGSIDLQGGEHCLPKAPKG